MIVLHRILAFIFCSFVALPILWMLYSAFLPAEAILYLDMTTFGFSLANFQQAFQSGIWRALAISLLVSGATVALQLVTGLMIAYALRAGLKLRWLVLFSLAIPSELLMVPLYRELQIFGLLNTLWALVLPFAASPLIIFLLYQSLGRLPWALVEAAHLDGASELRITFGILAPLLRPEMLAAAILAFAAHWNLVLFPKVMIDQEHLYTVQVFLNQLLRDHPLDWGLLGAASLLATLPLVLLYLMFEQRITQVFESSFK